MRKRVVEHDDVHAERMENSTTTNFIILLRMTALKASNPKK
jgi:hypothetical protein